ncbi:MAG: AraC family transcriptional regulator [Pseudomonadota bacterium]
MLQLTDPDAGFRVLSLQRMAQGQRWRTEAMRSYARPVLLWFTRGQGSVTVSGTTRGYGPHNAVFLPAGTMHGFSMMGSVFGYAVHFPRDMTGDFPDVPLHLRLRDGLKQAELTALVDAIEREARDVAPGMDRAMRHHGGLIAIWLERNADLAVNAQSRGATEHLVEAFTALVEQDFRSGAGVSSYAARLGVTPTHLSRVCRASCGQSASRLLAERVHFEARRLLQETDLNVSEISRRLGFRSPAYFTRAFQQKTGSTPSAFRRAN